VQSIQAKDLLAVPTKTWIACLVALGGVALIGLDGANEASISSLSLDSLQFSIGDLYIALGALFYTFHCIRLEKYAKTTFAVKLAAAKASTETMWCTLVVLACIVSATSDVFGLSSFDLARTSGDNILSYQESLSASLQDPSIPPRQWLILGAATAWTGLVTIAYTIYAQSFGQARVPPATANLIYTIQPFFTALVAFLVLGETLGPAGYVGGVLIGGAVLLVIAEEDPSSGGSRQAMK
jgi:drug/metabolite transporter (DMT)-like permease